MLRIFGAERGEITRKWKKLHNAGLQAFYSSKSKLPRWAEHVPSMDLSRNAYAVLLGKAEWKRPLGRLRRRWEDNLKMDLREVGCDAGDWIDVAQDRIH